MTPNSGQLSGQPNSSMQQEIIVVRATCGPGVRTWTYRSNFIPYLKTSLSVSLTGQNFSRSGELDNETSRLISKGKRKLNRDEASTMVDIDCEYIRYGLG